MPRESEPHYWPQRRLYYVMLGRKRHVLVRLAKGQTPSKAHEAAAWREYDALLAQLKRAGDVALAPGDIVTIATLVSRYLGNVRRAKSRAASTLKLYESVLGRLADALGTIVADTVTAKDIDSWLDDQGWSRNTRSNRIVILRMLWKWGVDQELIARNPMKRVERPPATPREKIATPDEARRLLAAPKIDWLRDAAELIYLTAARQSEVWTMTASDITFNPNGKTGHWTLHSKTSGITGEQRVIYFGERARTILLRWSARNPTGPLIRNGRGNAITNALASQHLVKVRAAAGLGDHVTLHSLRHLFATDAIERGVTEAEVAALLGHKGTEMVRRTYGRLRDRSVHLQSVLAKIRNDD